MIILTILFLILPVSIQASGLSGSTLLSIIIVRVPFTIFQLSHYVVTSLWFWETALTTQELVT